MKLDRNFQEIPKRMTVVDGGLDGLMDALNSGGKTPDDNTKDKNTKKLNTEYSPEVIKNDIKVLKNEFDKNNTQVLEDFLEVYEFFDASKILGEKKESILELYDILRENKYSTQEEKENYKITNKKLKQEILDLFDEEDCSNIKYRDIFSIKNKLAGAVQMLEIMENQISFIDKLKELQKEKDEVKRKEIVDNIEIIKKELDSNKRIAYKASLALILDASIKKGKTKSKIISPEPEPVITTPEPVIEPIPEPVIVSPEPETKIEIKTEKEKQEVIEKYFYKEGISQIIIHGVEIGDEEDGETNGLKHKLDLDVWSAMKLMELGGVKFKEGSKTSWISPKERLQYDEDGKPYFNSFETNPVVYKIGKHKGEFIKDKNGNQKFETKYSKLYLEPGTVVLDVGGTYGVDVMEGDIMQFDHHGETNKYNTSTTKEMFNVLKNIPEFRKNVKENTDTKDLKWMESYTDFVTNVDNLNYDVNPKNWETHHNTLYAVQRYFNSSNQEVMIDLFKNYGKVNLDGFSPKELNYVMAVGDKFYFPDDNRKERPQFKNIRSLQYNGKPEKPEFFEEDLFYKERLLFVRDFVNLQKRAVSNTNKAIEYNQVEMYEKDLPEYSEKLGKVLIDEKDITKKDVRNSFNAVGAYGHGYDSYVIFNINGNKKNEIFISTKKDASGFVDKIRLLLKDELGENYHDKIVVPVRDTMVVIQDKSLKSLDTDRVRAIMIEALELEDEVSIMIRKSNERTNKLIEESMNLINNINI